MAAINGMLVAGISKNLVGGKSNVGSIYVFAVPEPGSLVVIIAGFNVVALSLR